MKSLLSVCSALLLVGVSVAVVDSAGADNRKRQEVVRAQLSGYQEVPSVSSPGKGWFRAIIDEDAGMISYWLNYEGLENIAQSHLHVGQHHTNGGISVWLCTNLGGGQAQACPAAPAQITGTIMAEHVVGPAAQLVTAGEFAELLAAIRAGSVYVNVHTNPGVPAGEIRGQLR
jgi:hypothetical protein